MRSPVSFVHPRDEILQAIQRIYRYRMTTTSGGNLSIRDDNGDIWITPAGIDKGTLRREDIICIHGDGEIEGTHRPSSELPFHQEIYRTRPDIRGIGNILRHGYDRIDPIVIWRTVQQDLQPLQLAAMIALSRFEDHLEDGEEPSPE